MGEQWICVILSNIFSTHIHTQKKIGIEAIWGTVKLNITVEKYYDDLFMITYKLVSGLLPLWPKTADDKILSIRIKISECERRALSWYSSKSRKVAQDHTTLTGMQQIQQWLWI